MLGNTGMLAEYVKWITCWFC